MPCIHVYSLLSVLKSCSLVPKCWTLHACLFVCVLASILEHGGYCFGPSRELSKLVKDHPFGMLLHAIHVCMFRHLVYYHVACLSVIAFGMLLVLSCFAHLHVLCLS